MGPSRWCGGILWITLVESQAKHQDVENHIPVHPVVMTRDEATNKPWTWVDSVGTEQQWYDINERIYPENITPEIKIENINRQFHGFLPMFIPISRAQLSRVRLPSSWSYFLVVLYCSIGLKRNAMGKSHRWSRATYTNIPSVVKHGNGNYSMYRRLPIKTSIYLGDFPLPPNLAVSNQLHPTPATQVTLILDGESIVFYMSKQNEWSLCSRIYCAYTVCTCVYTYIYIIICNHIYIVIYIYNYIIICITNM